MKELKTKESILAELRRDLFQIAIAERLEVLLYSAISEGIDVDHKSLELFRAFIADPRLDMIPTIKLSDNGHVIARWFHDSGYPMGIEFKGGGYVTGAFATIPASPSPRRITSSV